MWASFIALSAVLLVQTPELVTPGDGRIVLPAGRVAQWLDSLPADLAPQSVGAPWPIWAERSPQGWGGEPSWRRWVELVRAEQRATTPERRAQLCVLARLQGRDEAAWEHLLACRADPGRAQALLAFFLPGVPQEWIGKSGPLPDGVILSPALPPTDAPETGLRALAGTKLTLNEFALGAARCSLSVSVDRDGIEVELRHLGGGAARFGVLAPLPQGVERGLLFADWNKLPEHQGPVPFELAAASAEADEGAPNPSEHSLWLTFHPPQERWPAPSAEMLRAPPNGREILLLSPRGDEAHLRLFAEALGELLGTRTRLAAEGFAPASGLEPLVLHLAPGASGERKLVELFGLCEALLLGPSGR
ncbi:MAG: hypothetical protein EXS08_00910 [Planctomycetes bacterium]|nr:hypothetical protein [Planctomycetota bacterium]